MLLEQHQSGSDAVKERCTGWGNLYPLALGLYGMIMPTGGAPSPCASVT
jgi:hypothetical protein